MTDSIKKFYTVQEAMTSLCLGRTSVYAEINAGRLESRLFGNKRLITAASIEAWAENLPEAPKWGGGND